MCQHELTVSTSHQRFIKKISQREGGDGADEIACLGMTAKDRAKQMNQQKEQEDTNDGTIITTKKTTHKGNGSMLGRHNGGVSTRFGDH